MPVAAQVSQRDRGPRSPTAPSGSVRRRSRRPTSPVIRRRAVSPGMFNSDLTALCASRKAVAVMRQPHLSADGRKSYRAEMLNTPPPAQLMLSASIRRGRKSVMVTRANMVKPPSMKTVRGARRITAPATKGRATETAGRPDHLNGRGRGPGSARRQSSAWNRCREDRVLFSGSRLPGSSKDSREPLTWEVLRSEGPTGRNGAKTDRAVEKATRVSEAPVPRLVLITLDGYVEAGRAPSRQFVSQLFRYMREELLRPSICDPSMDPGPADHSPLPGADPPQGRWRMRSSNES